MIKYLHFIYIGIIYVLIFMYCLLPILIIFLLILGTFYLVIRVII